MSIWLIWWAAVIASVIRFTYWFTKPMVRVAMRARKERRS